MLARLSPVSVLMPTPRTKSISTKVTEAEYERAASMAHSLTISEWARKTLLQVAEPDPIVTALLAELLALRTILLNLHFALLEGTTLTAETMQALINRADHDKWNKVDERLAVVRTRTESTRP
jgi:hypothetical protein